MTIGSRLVIQGTLFGCILLAGFLYLLTAGVSYPQPALAASPNQPTPASINSVPMQEASGGAASDAAAQGHCELSDRFPASVQQWCDLITYYAKLSDLSPDLVAALIWQESGGNPVAYSKSGAVGLMQVMPNDGLAASFMCPNGPCFSSRPSIEKLQDPEFNIDYGTKMLAGLITKHGNLRDALKSYGPMNMGYYYADKVLAIFENYKK